MDNIYEWLYDHYYRQQGYQAIDPELAPILQDAKDLLLSGHGDRLDREDALNLLRAATGTAAFAAGMGFCCRLLADFPYPGN